MSNRTRRKVVFLLALALTPFLFVQTRAKNPEMPKLAIPFASAPEMGTKAPSPSIYLSPDHALIAKIIWVPDADHEIFESRVRILSKSDKVLCVKDLTSSDHNHGGVVNYAAWSPDSQFFVATYNSSGGHQPYAWDALCYRRGVNKFSELGDYIGQGGFSDGVFFFQAPDIITIYVLKWGRNGLKEFGDPNTLSLRSAFQKRLRRAG